jgi:galactoside O-acetyltransferase
MSVKSTLAIHMKIFVAFLEIIPRLVVRLVRRLSMLSRAYAVHRVVPPLGAIISHARSMAIGKRFRMSEHCSLYCQDAERGSRLVIGDDVLLNVGVMINADCGGTILIGSRVLIGPYTVIRAANHRIDDVNVPIISQGHEPGSIVIEDDVWIGAHVTILPGVSIGRGAVIAAGSVVTRNIPAMAVAAGCPANVLRYRGQE